MLSRKVSARERAEFNKSCNVIGFRSGQNFLDRPDTAASGSIEGLGETKLTFSLVARHYVLIISAIVF